MLPKTILRCGSTMAERSTWIFYERTAIFKGNSFSFKNDQIQCWFGFLTTFLFYGLKWKLVIDRSNNTWGSNKLSGNELIDFQSIDKNSILINTVICYAPTRQNFLFQFSLIKAKGYKKMWQRQHVIECFVQTGSTLWFWIGFIKRHKINFIKHEFFY